jgi:hypothetical protein
LLLDCSSCRPGCLLVLVHTALMPGKQSDQEGNPDTPI